VKIMLFVGMTILGFAFATAIGIVIYFQGDLPSIEKLKAYDPPLVTEVYSSTYELIGKFYNEERYVLPLSSVPDHVLEAVLAAEDANFFSHHGIDFLSIVRAALKNLYSGGIKQGASTITQQVAKTFLLGSQRTFTRKVREMLLSYRIEKELNKHEILFLYLNQIYLGNGAYGLEAAARKYFGKHLAELTVAEAALLAGLPRAPSKYAPTTNPHMARSRQLYVLEQMLGQGMLDRKTYERAKAEKLVYAPPVDVNLEKTPYFTEMVRRYLVEHYGNENLLTKGYQVFTTVDVGLDRLARQALRGGLRELDKRQGWRGALENLPDQDALQAFLAKPQTPDEDGFLRAVVLSVDDDAGRAELGLGTQRGTILLEDCAWARPFNVNTNYRNHLLTKVSQALSPGKVILVRRIEREGCTDCYQLEQEPLVQGALFSVSQRSGFVRAMVGGYDFRLSEFDRSRQARRQPGSAFKPLIYAAALDKGYTPSTLILDTPVVFDDYEKTGLWKPENDGANFRGDTTFREALVHSLNIPTIKIVNDIGLKYILAYLRRLGLRAELNQDLSTALGSSVLTIEEVCRLYSVFANMGKNVPFVFITEIREATGAILEKNTFVEADASLAEQLTRIEDYAPQLDVETQPPPLEETETEPAAEDPNDPGLNPFGHLSAGRVLSSETAYMITHLLKGVVQYGTGFRARIAERPIAGKTGTTNDYLDAWFAGYSPQLTTVVWTGFDEKRSLGVNETGSQAAVPIWHAYMDEALRNRPRPDFAVPSSNLVFVKVDRKTGLLASASSQKTIYEVFLRGTEPTQQHVEKQRRATGNILFDDEVPPEL